MLDTICKVVQIVVGVITAYELMLIAKKTRLEIKQLKKKQDKDGG